jgi:hypothetical protein
VADFTGKYEELLDGKAIFVFFCCCFSNVRAWEPYCCVLTKESEPQKQTMGARSAVRNLNQSAGHSDAVSENSQRRAMLHVAKIRLHIKRQQTERIGDFRGHVLFKK